MPHKGEIVEKIARSKRVSLSELARVMKYDRATLYRHFADADLDDAIILKYAKALKYDFRNEFPQLLKYGDLMQEQLDDYRPVTLSEALREADAWKQKYIDLLERHNELLSSMIKEAH